MGGVCLESFQHINTFICAVFTALFVPVRIQTYQCSRWWWLLARFFFEFVTYQSLQSCQILCTNKQIFEKLQTLIQSLLHGKIQTHQCLGWCSKYCKILFLAKTKNEAAILWDAFSFLFVSYQPLQRCQISCATKHKVEKTNTLVQCS